MRGAGPPVPAALPGGARRQAVRRVPLGVAIVAVALLLGTLWYRQTYHVWPGQAAGSRVHWCGRDYEGGHSGPGSTLSLRQIQRTYEASYRPVGEYPPLAPHRSQVVARGCGPYVPTVIYLSVGPDQYVSYGLLGGP